LAPDKPDHRIKARAHGGGEATPPLDELNAMTKAWTYAALDALDAADRTTSLEIARIVCAAAFVIVPIEPTTPTTR
jgi:hypothetical protein